MSLANRRTTYNLTSIIITLHYLQEFTKYRACKKSNEEYKFEYLVSDETVKKGIEFLRGYLDFSPLIDKITNVSVSDKIDLKDKIISWVTKRQLPVAFRDIQMNVSGKPTKQQIINLCSDVFKIDGNKITSIL